MCKVLHKLGGSTSGSNANIFPFKLNQYTICAYFADTLIVKYFKIEHMQIFNSMRHISLCHCSRIFRQNLEYIIAFAYNSQHTVLLFLYWKYHFSITRPVNSVQTSKYTHSFKNGQCQVKRLGRNKSVKFYARKYGIHPDHCTLVETTESYIDH